MSKLDKLLKSFQRYIEVPDVSSHQLVFCVYTPSNERKLKVRINQFELAVQNAGYKWLMFDLTRMFADWLDSNQYKEKYFAKPDFLDPQERLNSFIEKELKAFIEKNGSSEKEVIAIWGTGMLFGFTQIHVLLERLLPFVQGRLVVFFPGSVEANNYRLLDLHDGGNYRAVKITEND